MQNAMKAQKLLPKVCCAQRRKERGSARMRLCVLVCVRVCVLVSNNSEIWTFQCRKSNHKCKWCTCCAYKSARVCVCMSFRYFICADESLTALINTSALYNAHRHVQVSLIVNTYTIYIVCRWHAPRTIWKSHTHTDVRAQSRHASLPISCAVISLRVATLIMLTTAAA